MATAGDVLHGGVFLDVLVTVPFAVGQAEEPLLQYWVLPVSIKKSPD
jgi:hypothetical protein